MAKQFTTSQKRGILIILGALVLLAGWRWRAAHLAAAPDEAATVQNAPQPQLLELNAADTTALQTIKGIGPASARRIVRYRELIGGFNSIDQLLKVYGISPENFIRIEEQVYVDTTGAAFAALRKAKPKRDSYQRDFRPRYPEHRSYKDKPQVEWTQNANPSFPASTAPTHSPQEAAASAPARRPLLDINTADSTELLAISGIGAGTARNIVKYRSLIYFYESIDQLSEVWGVRPENLERMKPYLTVGESRKAMPHLRINEMTVDEMGRHKYLGFKEARILVAYREMHGAFADFEAVQKVLGIAPEKLEKLRPYLVY